MTYNKHVMNDKLGNKVSEKRKLQLKRNMFECKGRTFLVWK